MPVTVWCVFAATADAAGEIVAFTHAGLWLNCGHQHTDQAEAERCAWEPDDAPEVYAGLVLEVHPTYFRRFAQGKMPWAARPLRQSRRLLRNRTEVPACEREHRQERMPWD